MTRAIHHGCNLRLALEYARTRGCRIHSPRRTGELVIEHAELSPARVRLNACRKDAPRALTAYLLRLVGGGC